jgi:hypothetical protein
VLVRRTIKPGMLGIWNGVGLGWGWEGEGQLKSNLGPRWTGSYHDKEGFQVSKRGMGLKQQMDWQGEQKQRDCAIIVLLICVHIK